MKKTISILGMMMAFIISAFAVNASPTTHSIYVDGVKQNVGVYAINGNNYFKLRDIAAVVNGTSKQFEVSWDSSTNAISLTSNKEYTTVGGELGSIASGTQDAKPSTAIVYKDGAVVSYTGYNINNNNFYKLRDVAQSFNIGIKWDDATQRVDIITTESYSDDNTSTNDDAKTDIGTDDTNTKSNLAVGELSAEWKSFVENSGEETVSVTFNFSSTVRFEETKIPNAKIDLYYEDLITKSFERIYVATIQTGSDGTGSYTLDMPKSVYTQCFSARRFGLYGQDVTFNGKTYEGGDMTYEYIGSWSNRSLDTTVYDVRYNQTK